MKKHPPPEVDTESPVSLAAVTRLPALSRDGRKPHLATVYRWVTRGIRGVRLESFLVGGSRCTTPALVEKFLARLNAPGEAMPPRTPTRRERDHRRADKSLAAAGW